MFAKDNINFPVPQMTRQSRIQSNPLKKEDLKCISSFLSEIKKDVSFSARQFGTNPFWFYQKGILN